MSPRKVDTLDPNATPAEKRAERRRIRAANKEHDKVRVRGEGVSAQKARDLIRANKAAIRALNQELGDPDEPEDVE